MIYIAVMAVLIWSGASSSGVKDKFPELVKELVRHVKMPDAKLRDMMALIQTLKTILGTRWPGCDVSMIGSTVYGLAMHSSDLDCIVTLPSHISYENITLVTAEAKKLLQEQPVFENFFTWTNVSVPVLSFEHKPTQIDVDVSINNRDEGQRSQLIRYMLHLDERAYYLAFIVKFWSNVCGHIFLRNHGYMLLVIFYLQQKQVLPSIASLQKNATPFMIDEWDFGFDTLEYETQNSDSLTSIIGGFFTFYGEYDFENYIVSPYVGYPVSKHAFQYLQTVPVEFELYKKNVKSNMSQPLPAADGVMIQDAFVQNEYIDNSYAGPELRAVLKEAETIFQRNPKEFLKILRKRKSLLVHNFG